MIETIHLLPPDLGPRSNPVLFGIAEALAGLLPPVILVPRSTDAPVGEAEERVELGIAEASDQGA